MVCRLYEQDRKKPFGPYWFGLAEASRESSSGQFRTIGADGGLALGLLPVSSLVMVMVGCGLSALLPSWQLLFGS